MNTLRWLVMIVGLVAIAGVLLALRHERLRVMHETIQTHRDLTEARQDLWDLQVAVNGRLTTPELREAAREAGLPLEPAPMNVPPPEPLDIGDANLVVGEALP